MVGWLSILAFGVLGARLVQVQVIDHPTHVARAKAREVARLRSETVLPRIRGRIIDRNGVVLADNVDAYEVAVAFDFMTGEWEEQRARSLERESAGGRAALSKLPARERASLHDQSIAQASMERREILAAIASAAQVSPAEIESRMADLAAGIERRGTAYRDRLAASGRPARERLREEVEAHAVVEGLPAEDTFGLNKLADRFGDVIEVRSAPRRIYPEREARVTLGNEGLPGTLERRASVHVNLTDVGDLIVGSVRDTVQAADLRRRPFEDGDSIDWGGYREATDLIGVRGIERAWEDTLRGEWGLRERVRQPDGSVEQRLVKLPVDGGDVQLTIDVELQRRVQAILSPEYGLTLSQREFHTPNADMPRGLELNAAVVVVEVATGEVLAMASQPGPGLAGTMSELEERARSPWIDRSVDAAYAPGSILKPIVYLSAVAAGEASSDEVITCNGHFFPDRKDLARCWLYRTKYGLATHGPLAPHEALARSCNIYFYELADRLGPAALSQWLGKWGLGQPLHAGLEGWRERSDGMLVRAGESGGSLPTEQRVEAWRADGDRFSGVIMGIGQGELAWSPLQAANALATLARGGTVNDAHVVRGRAIPGHRAGGSIGLSPSSVRNALDGMHEAIDASHGTAHHVTTAAGREEIFALPGVRVWGKTGTAQAGLWRLDVDQDGTADRSVGDADHAWFACLVGDEATDTPRYAIAVIVERAGSGGRAAGPVAAAVARELSKLGYLRPVGERRRAIDPPSHQPESDG